jgi:hypothetical protein
MELFRFADELTRSPGEMESRTRCCAICQFYSAWGGSEMANAGRASPLVSDVGDGSNR